MKIKLKRIVDIIMIVLLPVLMTFQVTGQMLHEWLGAAMLILAEFAAMIEFWAFIANYLIKLSRERYKLK